MNVPSYQFLMFAVVVALAINVSGKTKWRRAVLLVANLAFVLSFTHDPALLAPFAALLALGFAGMKWMDADKRQAAFVFSVVSLLIVFCWLKRYTFVPHEVFLPYAYLTVGMSYVFFRVLSLVIDAYQASLPERVGIVSYLNYTLNFTSLVSGPIQLFREYRLTETERPLKLTSAVVSVAFERIIIGFFKVSVGSPLLAYAQQRSVDLLPANLAGFERIAVASIALGLYPLFLYVNFSGYMDFVIGIAAFMRLKLPENFNKPFESQGFIEFWSRWHMTLSNWLKTYVYSPLLIALMRRFPSQRLEPYLGVFVYFVTFFLVGVWHGQTTMFLFYGVLLGLGVSVNKFFQITMISRLGRPSYRKLCERPWYSLASRGLTFLWFAFSLLWFWSTWTQLATFVVILGLGQTLAAVALVFILATLLLAISTAGRKSLQSVSAYRALVSSAYARTALYTAVAAVTVSVLVVLDSPAPRIVYRAF